MAFTETLIVSFKGTFPSLLWWMVFPLIPFIITEQLRPVDAAPRLKDYGMNMLISLSAVYLTMPLSIAAGLWSAQARNFLPWQPLSLTFDSIRMVPIVGPMLETLAMIFVPLFLYDFWFYWCHRLEHKVPLLWAFHKIHHSDRQMNVATWARDHFLQNAWRAFFSAFTLGLFIDLDLTQAGKALLYSNMFLSALAMFHHSAIRVRVPGFNRIFVTPQVHRIHHSTVPAHYNRNFADALPIFDIIFGTYCLPGKDEFPPTGLSDFPPPRSLWSAQFGPLADVGNMLRPKRRAPAGAVLQSQTPSQAHRSALDQ